MSYKAISYRQRGPIGVITLNRPETDNAIDTQMAVEMEEICQRVNQEKDTTVVILTGAGDKSFCSGEEISQSSHAALGETPWPDRLKDFALRYNVAARVSEIECPVVAAINGNAMGAGLALALACDLRVASAQALFGVPDLRRGYFLASGITQWLPRIVGRGKAMELILTAQAIDATEAHRIGLVHRVVPQQELLLEADKMAQEVASKAPIALRYVKEAVNKGLDLTLDQGLKLECDLYMILHTTGDRTEGITAFRDKGQPAFRGE